MHRYAGLFRRGLAPTDEYLEFMLVSYATSDTVINGVAASDYDAASLCTNGDMYLKKEEDDPGHRADKKDTEFHLILFGRLRNGASVAFNINFWPCLVVDIPESYSKIQAQQLVNTMAERYRVPLTAFRSEVQWLHPTAGFYPDLKSAEPKIGTRPFILIWCKSMAYFYSIKHFFDKQVINGVKYECIETNIPAQLQFLQVCKSKPCAIMRVKSTCLIRPGRRFSHCDVEYACTVRSFHGYAIPFEFREVDDIFPMVITSFDIECRAEKGRFPDATDPSNHIISICTKSKNTATGQILSSVHALKEYTKLPDDIAAVQEWFDSEADLLESFRDFLVLVVDPDITTGYNIHGFDWPYINNRAEKLLSAGSRFWYMSRLITKRCYMEEKEFSSKAFGASSANQFCIPGRVDTDLYTYIKRNYKFKSYKLGDVAKTLVNNTKKDLPIDEMNDCHNSGDPLRRQRVHEYCLQDAWLPLEIWDTQYILEAMVEMSRVTFVFLSDLFERGQSFKVLCMLYIFARNRGYVLNKLPDFSHLDTYKGATVLDMKNGFMKDVVVLDFASLYPSIMQALNLCYTSWVREPAFDNLPGWTYNTEKTDIGEFRWQTTITGLLPQMAASLGEQRAQAKKRMNAAKEQGDTSKKIIFNARQLALKVSCNSIYGFTGAAKMGKYSCPPIAATTTCYGRFLIAETKRRIEETYADYGADCVYGDTDSTMVIFRQIPNTEDGYRQVFELGNEAAALISSAFHPAIILENEKVYRRVIMLKKKHYVAKSQEHPSEAQKLDVKGVMMVRRDFCEYQQANYSNVIKKLLDDEAPLEALWSLEQAFRRLMDDQVPLDDLTLTRQLAKEYKNEHMCQKVVADKIEARMPGAGPKPGDRVGFVPVVLPNGHAKAPLYQRVEDVDYVRQTGMRVDFQYYINSFQTSMEDLFDAFGHRGSLRTLVEKYSAMAMARMHGNQSVLDFFPRKNERDQEEHKEEKTEKESPKRHRTTFAPPTTKAKRQPTKAEKLQQQQAEAVRAREIFAKAFPRN